MTEKLNATTVSREYMEKLIDCMDDMLVVISPEGVIQSVNRAYCELFECQPETVIGRRMDEFDEQDAPCACIQLFIRPLHPAGYRGLNAPAALQAAGVCRCCFPWRS